MPETAPTNVEDKLASMQARIVDANQVSKDKERLHQWIGFDPDKETFTDKQVAKAESMNDYLQARPANEQELAVLEEMQADKLESTDGEYEPTSDMDKELAYLEQEFNTVSSPEDVAAALDLVSDFCDAHNLDRAAEKQLRAKLLRLSENESEDKTSGGESPLTDEVEKNDKDVEPAQERDNDEKFTLGTIVAILRDDKTTVEGEIVDFQEDNDGFKYVIEANDGGRYAVPASMVVLPEAVDYSVYAKLASQEDDDNTPDEGGSNGTPEHSEEPKDADEGSSSTDTSGSEEPAGTQDEQGTEGTDGVELNMQDKIMAKALLIAGIIKQKKNEALASWHEAPRKKKILYGVGAVALVAASVWLLKENANMFDGGTDVTAADTPGADTPLAGGPDAIDAPNVDTSSPSPDSNSSGGPSGPDTSFTVSEAAQNVEKGEGWFQTFEELGIKSESDQNALLKQIGPKLVKMGVAYSDAGIGGYGISAPGELPSDVIKMITNVAKAEGYIS